MSDLRYTLVSDGSSDEALLPLLNWLLRQNRVSRAIQAEWADLRRLQRPPKSLPARIQWSIELYPCDLVFVHRDAEREPPAIRVAEIEDALTAAVKSTAVPPAVCVVPVRMQEAWLLFDEAALRRAAANPNGRMPMALPPLADVEQRPDPKGDLHELLREASGLTGRRRRRLRVRACAKLVTQFIADFSPLRTLPAFSALEADIRERVAEHNWAEA
ncbi:MAG: hypothetical protein COZ06_01185 [Armatimonadetes bacterium CG_4_10_14_3_um_filter_66_18]|nr:DUF4276 family protein [Armatimonadota bacterium]OIO92478.1 MAG: hypothetical protein AUJ96_32185 [Armatimonadetes bacterium CG2_30_66_41]PIU90126.1 MAG: hypothetical protein COS65_26200 [Armatimonadetes bacterium CG06_land_8_20_14_3_00_66_21]PIW13636.1 MAG: hypothetical protein COW34_08475 [Armatimonadetes bacterium CG17_big_fil_post_rev_8_21_14_2_50_66_6]PIX49851.1 MAG: hypothetical protein COZ57_01940 [Armatimonadetes bacterium CG_4_8_14_3_um_filter_66_20]PIY53764.1 MAG: hypothetical pro